MQHAVIGMLVALYPAHLLLVFALKLSKCHSSAVPHDTKCCFPLESIAVAAKVRSRCSQGEA